MVFGSRAQIRKMSSMIILWSKNLHRKIDLENFCRNSQLTPITHFKQIFNWTICQLNISQFSFLLSFSIKSWLTRKRSVEGVVFALMHRLHLVPTVNPNEGREKHCERRLLRNGDMGVAISRKIERK